jgi:hypothetical protein
MNLRMMTDTKPYWHMAYVRITTNIARWIQINTGAYPATNAWACTRLSNNPPTLIHAIEALKTALSIDGLQEETMTQSQPFGTDHPPQIIVSTDTDTFARDCIQAFATLDYNSETWMSLLSTINDEQRGFTMLEGALACELARSRLLPLHTHV